LRLVLMILILSSLGYSTNLSAFASLKPSSIDNRYDIPIAMPIVTGTTEGNVSTLATCEKLPVTSVTAIGNDGNTPSNIIDNNLNTRWSNNGVGSWIQLDLGSKRTICSVDIAWYRGDMRVNNFEISVFNDAKSSGTTTSSEKYDMPAGTEGRYVMIKVNGNTENNWASITEIAVFGARIGSEPPSPPPAEPPSPPPTSTDFPYTFVGSPQDMEDEGWDERRYASGKPPDITHEWSGETSAQNYAIIIDITLTEIDHDDTISFKFGGTHMGSGWYDNTYSFESGQSCIGKEEDHPSTDLCVITGKSIGNLVNTPVKLAAVNIGKGEKLEMYSNLGSGWTKDVESSNGVDGFRPQVEVDEAVIRIDAAPGIEMRSAQIVELDPASTSPTNILSPPPSDKMATTEDDGWTEGEYAGTPDEQNEQARQDWEAAGRPGDRYTGLPTP
jgi:F5/8 type C domain